MALKTTVQLSRDLPYPIIIAQLYVKPGEHVEKGQRLFAYKYWDIQDVLVKDEEKPLKKRVDLVGNFDSPYSGTVESWSCKVDDEFTGQDHDIITIKQDCNHDITYGGLCVQCGKSVDEEENDKNLNISHANVNIKVSEHQAESIERTSLTRLRQDKKLVLVVDLDQTVIHCGVDPTIGEWARDPKNPNYNALQDVKSFALEDEPIIPSFYFGPKPPARKSWYYVKLRPGLKDFFDAISPHFEMHIYTMATRSYALEIAKIIDPTGKLFGDRILSRDENGSLTTKSLERLFPMDQSMVVVIDDRGDVWNWFENLIKVVPYSFFVGIGDINSNFLPRQQNSILHLGRHHRKKQEEDRLISDIMDNEKRLKEKIDEEVKRQEQEMINHIGEDNRKEAVGSNKEDISKKLEHSASLEVQQQNRPLAELQKHMHNQTLLIDEDDELPHLSKILLNVHEEYFREYQQDPQNPPDIKYLLPKIKSKVFNGCHFVFSGLIPLETDVNKADIVLWTNMFGASTSADITYETTHVITRTSGTFKARLAKSFNPDIKIVHPDWIFECLVQWEKVKEGPYELLIEEPVEEAKVNEFKEILDKRINGDENSSGLNQELAEDDEYNLLAGNDSWLDNDDDEMDELLNDEDEDESNDDDKDNDLEQPQSKRRKVEVSNIDKDNKQEVQTTEAPVEDSGSDDDLDDDLEAELLQELEG